MSIKELSLFKTKETMKSLDKNTFKNGNPALGGEVPPVVSNEEETRNIEQKTE